MESFKKFYLFALNAKSYMGLFFTGLVFMVSIITLCCGGDAIRLAPILTMMLTAIMVGFSQAVLLDNADFSGSIFFGRSVLWLLLSTAVTMIFSVLFGWFEGLPQWSYMVLAVVTPGSLVALLVGQKFEWEAGTMKLNQDLKGYQHTLEK